MFLFMNNRQSCGTRKSTLSNVKVIVPQINFVFTIAENKEGSIEVSLYSNDKLNTNHNYKSIHLIPFFLNLIVFVSFLHKKLQQLLR